MGASVCCHPNLHSSFQSLRPFRHFFRDLFNYFDAKYFAKFTEEFKPRNSPHKKKKTFPPVSLEERNWFSRGVSLGIRTIEGLIENGRVTLRKVQVEP